MLCTRPGGEVVAAFSDQLQGEVRTKTVDRRDVLFRAARIAPRGRRKPERSPDRFCADAAGPVPLIQYNDRDGCTVPSPIGLPAMPQTDSCRGSVFRRGPLKDAQNNLCLLCQTGAPSRTDLTHLGC